MNEHDATAPAAFCFLYNTSTKNFIVIIKNMQLISYQSKTGLVMERGPERCMTENTFIFNVFVYVQYLVLTCCSLK